MATVESIQAKIDALEKQKEELMRAETELIGSVAGEVFRKELSGKTKKEMKAFFKEVRSVYLRVHMSDDKGTLQAAESKPVMRSVNVEGGGIGE